MSRAGFRLVNVFEHMIQLRMSNTSRHIGQAMKCSSWMIGVSLGLAGYERDLRFCQGRSGFSRLRGFYGGRGRCARGPVERAGQGALEFR